MGNTSVAQKDDEIASVAQKDDEIASVAQKDDEIASVVQKDDEIEEPKKEKKNRISPSEALEKWKSLTFQLKDLFCSRNYQVLESLLSVLSINGVRENCLDEIRKISEKLHELLPHQIHVHSELVHVGSDGLLFRFTLAFYSLTREFTCSAGESEYGQRWTPIKYSIDLYDKDEEVFVIPKQPSDSSVLFEITDDNKVNVKSIELDVSKYFELERRKLCECVVYRRYLNEGPRKDMSEDFDQEHGNKICGFGRNKGREEEKRRRKSRKRAEIEKIRLLMVGGQEKEQEIM